MVARRKIIAAVVTLVLIAGLMPAEMLFFHLDAQSQDIKRQWPAVPGIVTAVKIEKTGSNFFEDTYDLHVDYEYEVQGITYQEDLGWETNSPGENQGYFIGKRINVHYDPTHPGRAYIELRPSGWIAPLILMPIAIVFGCIAIWLWAFSKLKRVWQRDVQQLVLS